MHRLPRRLGRAFAFGLALTALFRPARADDEPNVGVLGNVPVFKEGASLPSTIDFDATPAPAPIDLPPLFEIPAAGGDYAKLSTTFGDIYIEFFNTEAPLSVANFKSYLATDATPADDLIKTYDGVFVHRSVKNFVIQTGGYKLTLNNQSQVFPLDVTQKPAVDNEFKIANTRGTLAMAKLDGDPDSATNQWFINLADNRTILDNQNGGFTAFARVLGDGMKVVDKIAALPAYNLGGGAYSEVPMQGYKGGNLALKNFVYFKKIRAVSPSEVPVASRSIGITYSVVGNTNPAAAVASVNKTGALTFRPGKTGGRSVVTVRALAQNGTYHDATITTTRVGPPVLLKAPPAKVSGNLGGSVTLRADVTAWPLNIKWQRKAPGSDQWLDLDTEDERFEGITTQDLVIHLDAANTAEASSSLDLDQSQFRFVVSNTIADVSRTLEGKPTTLTVVSTLAFLDKLAKTTTAALGTTVTLTARAVSGTLPAPTYQWQRKAPDSADWVNLVASTTEAPTLFANVATASLRITLGATFAGAPLAARDLDKTQFRCVITHDLGDGPVSLASTVTTLRVTTLPVGFAVQPPKLFSGLLGHGATVSVTALGAAPNTPLSYQWQRLPAGADPKVPANWQTLVNSTAEEPTRYTGAKTRTLTVSLAASDEETRLAALALGGDQYRCVVSNVLGTATSAPASLQVRAEQFSLVTLEDHALPGLVASEGRSFSAKGLPKGLSIDPESGRISGTAAAKAGTYAVTITIRQNGAVIETIVYHLEVIGLSGNNAGGFEAFLSPSGDAQPPLAKLSLLVSSTGAFTGTLSTTSETKPLPLKGVVKRDASTGRLSLAAPLHLKRSGAPASALYYRLDFAISGDGALTVSLETAPSPGGSPSSLAETDDENLPGVQLGSFANSANGAAPWAKATAFYTVAFADATPLATDPLARPIPAGSGYATTIMYYNGTLEFRGKTGDGVPFTATLPAGEDGSYRLFVRNQHGGAPGACLAANLKLSPASQGSTRYSIIEADRQDAYWTKPANVKKTTGYPAGFGPLGLTLRMEPCGNITFATLGMEDPDTTTGTLPKLDLLVSGETLDNTGANPRSLPVQVKYDTVSGKFLSSATPDSSALSIELTLTGNSLNGGFVGTLKLADAASGDRTVTRTVPIEGVFLPIPALTSDTLVAEGLLLIPAFDFATGSTKGPVTTSRIQLFSLPDDNSDD